MNKERFLIVSVLSVVILTLFVPAVYTDSSLSNPLLVPSKNGSQVSVSPYIYVKDSSSYSFLAAITDINKGKVYSFEDGMDGDYDDVTVKLTYKDNSQVNTMLYVKVTERNSDFDHEVWLRVIVPDDVVLFFRGNEYTAGTYDIKIFDSSRQSLHSTAVLKVRDKGAGEEDFEFDIEPERVEIEAGGTASLTARISPLGGFKGEVKLESVYLPEGFTADFNPQRIDTEGTSALSLFVDEETDPGTYRAKFKASSGSIVHDASVVVTVIRYNPGISITKSANKTLVTPGEEVEFTILVENSGDVDLKNLTVSDALHEALELIEASPDYSEGEQGMNFTFPELKIGKSAEIKIKVKIRDDIDDEAVISNIALVVSDRIDRKYSNRVVLTLGIPTVTVIKSVKNVNRNFRPGGIIIYELVISNRGTAPLREIKVIDQLPNGFYYIKSRTLVNGKRVDDPVVEGSQLLWSFETLSSGDSLRIIYQVSISSSVRNGRHLNSAIVRAIDGAGREKTAGPAQAVVTVSRGGVLLWSSITGTVFVDVDDDNEFGPDDIPVKGVEVFLDNGEKSITDKSGEYLFESVLPGEHVLSIDPRKLPDKYSLVKEFYMLSLMEGAREYLDISLGLKDEGKITGTVIWLEKNEFETDLSLEGIKVLLNDEFYVKTDSKGEFVFSRVPTGNQIITLAVDSLSGGLVVSGDQQVSIDVKTGEAYNIVIRLTGNPFGTIVGLVKSSVSLASLDYSTTAFADITILLNGKEITRTNSHGRFEITEVAPGDYEVALKLGDVRKRNFILQSEEIVNIRIEADKTQLVEFLLKPLKLLIVEIN